MPLYYMVRPHSGDRRFTSYPNTTFFTMRVLGNRCCLPICMIQHHIGYKLGKSQSHNAYNFMIRIKPFFEHTLIRDA